MRARAMLDGSELRRCRSTTRTGGRILATAGRWRSEALRVLAVAAKPGAQRRDAETGDDLPRPGRDDRSAAARGQGPRSRPARRPASGRS